MTSYTKDLNLSCLPLHRKYRTSKFLDLHKKYRSHFEIIALVLEAVKDNCATRFSIMKRAGINCSQLKKYLPSLTGIGFIDMSINDGHVIYRTSVKGLDFLRQYYVLLGMLLGAHVKDDLRGVIYESEYNASIRQSGSPQQVVTRLQHPP